MSDQLYRLVVAVGYAIPSFAMSARLLHVWRAPLEVEEGRWVSLGVGVMVMEFILLNVGVFLGVQATEGTGLGVFRIALILGFHLLFVGAIVLSFRSPSLATSFLWLVGGRLVATLLGVGREDAELLKAHSVVGSVLYMAMVFASVFIPIPRLGITEAVTRRHGMAGASGTWAEEPHRAIAAGAVYFFLLGVFELALLSWMDPRRIVP